MRFAFSDLSNAKLSPALVLADEGRGDGIVAQITSKASADRSAISMANSDFETGSLMLVSFVRPGKLFTPSQALFTAQAGILTPGAFEQVVQVVDAVIQRLRPMR